MKLDKDTLKMIVKECLVEILAEGLASDISRNKKSSLNESMTRSKSLNRSLNDMSSGKVTSKNTNQNTRPNYLDNIKFGNNSEPDKNRGEKIANNISKFETNPVMQDIFADTAQTTLLEQSGAEGSKSFTTKPADAAAAAVSKSNPEDIFGEQTASKWAHLAFN